MTSTPSGVIGRAVAMSSFGSPLSSSPLPQCDSNGGLTGVHVPSGFAASAGKSIV